MSIETAIDLLCCPGCGSDLGARTDGSLRCEQGHSFDRARHGYLNLSGRAEPANADTAAMLAARQRVQSAGVFADVAGIVADQVNSRHPVLEAGAGTGYYLLAALGGTPDAVGVAMDIAKASARLCARLDQRIAAVVADIWSRWPVHDHCLGAIISAFAPRNLPEAARTLRPDGRLIVVTPRPTHLAGLRDAYGLLDIPAEKAERVTAEAAEFFDLIDTRLIRHRRVADAALARDLIAMGPNAFHTVPDQVLASTVAIDVTVQTFRPLGD